MILSIQLLRFVACCLVLFAHLPAEVLGGINTKFCGSIGVDIFFIISGFVMCSAMATRGEGGFREGVDFLLRRLNRIWPLYVIFTILFAIESTQITWYANNHHLASLPDLMATVDWTHVVKSLMILPISSEQGYYIDPVLSVGWTLTFELYFYIVVSLLLMFRIKSTLALLCVFAIPISISLIDMPWTPFYSLIASPMLLEFVLGYWLASVYRNKPYLFERYAPVFLVMTPFLLALAMLGHDSGWYRNLARMTIEYPNDMKFHRIFSWGIPSALFFIGFLGLESRIRRSQLTSFLAKKMGDATFSLYLLQIPLIHFLIAYGVSSHGVGRFIYIILPIVLAIIVYNFLEKPILQRLNRITHSFVEFCSNVKNFQFTWRDYVGGRSRLVDAFIALLAVLFLNNLIGPDVWAETQSEYLDCIKSIDALFSKGWFGYWAFVPKSFSYLYNMLLSTFVHPDDYARFIVDIIVFSSLYFSLRLIETVQVKLLLILSSLNILMHQSSFSLTNCSYVMMMPLIIVQLKSLVSGGYQGKSILLSQVLYLSALLSKATFLFFTLPLSFARNWVFLLLAFAIGMFQLIAMNGAAGSSVSAEHLLSSLGLLGIIYVVISTLGAVFDFSFLGAFVHNSRISSSLPLFVIGLATISALTIPRFLSIKNSSDNFFKKISYIVLPLAIVYAAIFPFCIWFLITNNNFSSIDKSFFNIVYTNVKLQYLIIATPVIALSIAMACVQWGHKKWPQLIVLLLCFGSFLSILNQWHSIGKSYADSKLSLFDEFRPLPYYKCFAIPPFPSDYVAEGMNLNSLFLVGGCRRFTMYNKFSDGAFTEPSKDYDFSKNIDGLYTYLGIISRVEQGGKMNPSLRFWEEKCAVIAKTAKLSHWIDEDNFLYVTGLIEKGGLTPDQLNERLPYCFGMDVKEKITSTVIVILPDHK